ncbi:MAG: cytochrome c [Candidatus Dadabacteria bacterium]|nr:MAG: cytochrome c [Candidatus Dadabacteria bacterium]
MVFIVREAFAVNQKGEELYQQRCVSCHGSKGKGDGPVAAGLPANMKPRDLTKGPFKVATSKEKTKEVIKKGGAAFGLNAMMPPQPDLSDSDLEALAEFVMSLREKK